MTLASDRGAVLQIDSTNQLFDIVTQNIQTESSAQYMLAFDIRTRPVDVNAEPNPNGVTAADCVRAAWFACSTYLHAPGGVQAEQEDALREIFAYLAQDHNLANTWYDNVKAMV